MNRKGEPILAEVTGSQSYEGWQWTATSLDCHPARVTMTPAFLDD